MMGVTVMMAALFAAVSVDANIPARHLFSMSCKVTSCNSELATPAGRERAIAWFRTNHITKLWLESYRHTESVPTERLIEERDAFRKAGFNVCGMITPTQLNAPGKDGKRPMVVCWSDPEARNRLRAEAVRAVGVFDTVILDDFLFSHCGDGCARCKADKARRGITDWGAYRRALLYEVCERDVLAAARAANPKAHFIIKYPCWYRHHAQNGYDVVRQTKLFGECWIGTETRDANPQPLQACWIMDRFDRLTEGRCGGGWYDGLDSSPEKFVEQAYYTILGGARESLVHCYDYLVADDPGVTPFGEKATRGHACAAAFTHEIDRLQELGDFLCGTERLGYVRGADGVSRHRFRKNGRTYLARLNTTDKEADGLPPHGFDFRDEAKVPLALHPIFQDGLTFAANRPIRVYGSGAGRVEVEFCGKKAEGRPMADGWLAELPAVLAGGPYVLRVTLGGTVREVRGVTVGEVWLMSGQSNMKDKVAKKPFEPVGGVRVYSAQSVERGERFSPKDGWVAVTKEAAPEFSALACYFGRERWAKGVEHVGLVSCAQGASIIESWLPASATRTPSFNLAPGDLHPDHDAAPYLDWNAPGGMYDFGFRTLGPFSFTGVVWYQGESDTTVAEAAVYPDLLKTMVSAWRRDLRDAELPFFVIQIADFDGRKDAGWRSLQDAQAKAVAQIPGVTLVRSADVCATDDIHPAGKDRLAKRLSEQADSLDVDEDSAMGSRLEVDHNKEMRFKKVFAFSDIGDDAFAAKLSELNVFAAGCSGKPGSKEHAEQLARAKRFGIVPYVSNCGPGAKAPHRQTLSPEEAYRQCELAGEFLPEDLKGASRGEALNALWQKQHYRWGGEPENGNFEVYFEGMGGCFVGPKARAAGVDEIVKRLKAEPEAKAVCLDYIGYGNYHGCYHPHCLHLLKTWLGEKGLADTQANRDRFFEDELVAYYNALYDAVKVHDASVVVYAHLYPVFKPNPLFGNRLKLDYCGQTCAWYSRWPAEKVKKYAETVVRGQRDHWPFAHAAPFIAYGPWAGEIDPDFKKTPEDVERELRTFLEAGAEYLAVHEIKSVIDDPAVFAVFKKYCGKPGWRDCAVAVSDTNRFTCGSGPSSTFLADRRIACVPYLASETGRGECHDIAALAEVPVDSPEKSRSYVLCRIGETFCGHTVSSVLSFVSFPWKGRVRVTLDVNYGVCGWRDWDPTTHRVVGEGLYKCRFGKDAPVEVVTPDSLTRYLDLKGMKGHDVLRKRGDRLINGARPHWENGAFYGVLTSSWSQPIAYRCDDGETFEFLGVIPTIAEYECQLAKLDGRFYALMRGAAEDNFWVSDDGGATFRPCGRLPDGKQRPQLFVYGQDLLIAYSAPDEKPSLVRNGRNNLHILLGRGDDLSAYREVLHEVDPLGIVYYDFIVDGEQLYILWSNASRFPTYVKWGAVQGKDLVLFSHLGLRVP